MRYRSFLLIALTIIIIVLNWVFPYGSPGHAVLVHTFFIVMVLTAFFNRKLLFPLVIVYVVFHTAHDVFSHGTIPLVTALQSSLHLLAAVVFNKVFTLKENTYQAQHRLIETMDLGHAHFIGVKDAQGEVNDIAFITVNEAFAALFNTPGHHFEHGTLKALFKDYPEQWFKAFNDVIEHGKSIEKTIYVQNYDRHFRLSFYVPFAHEGAVVVRDITQYKRVSQRIQYLHRHDELTGLYNREYLTQVLNEHINESKTAIGIVLFDIDNLEILNRAFNHSAGDEAIKTAVEIIKKRAQDDYIVFRYGGDEFVAFTTIEDEAALKTFAREVELDFSAQAVNQISLTITSSIALKHEHEGDKESILVDAEKTLYERKVVQMDSSHIQTLKGILALLSEKYAYEKTHSERVSQLAQTLAEAMGLSDLQVEEAKVSAMFHDIGKIGIPDAILGKPSKLSDEEFETIKQHSVIGHRILSATAPKTPMCTNVLHHHERFNGKGYPEGLQGYDIPLISRIIMVVDAFEAMTSRREYSDAMKTEAAIEEIIAHKGTQFDPDIAEVFINEVLKEEESENNGKIIDRY